MVMWVHVLVYDSTNAFQEQSIKKQHLINSLQQLIREKQGGISGEVREDKGTIQQLVEV